MIFLVIFQSKGEEDQACHKEAGRSSQTFGNSLCKHAFLVTSLAFHRGRKGLFCEKGFRGLSAPWPKVQTEGGREGGVRGARKGRGGLPGEGPSEGGGAEGPGGLLWGIRGEGGQIFIFGAENPIKVHFRNTPSTAGNFMTGSERPSPEPLLKKEASPAVLGGENSGTALEPSNAVNYSVWGIPAVLSRGIPGKALRAFPGSFRTFSGIFSGKSQPYWGCGP